MDGFKEVLADTAHTHHHFSTLVVARNEVFEFLESGNFANSLEFEQINKIEEKYGDSTFLPCFYKILKLKAKQNLSIPEV
jgi:hypothetical protein